MSPSRNPAASSPPPPSATPEKIDAPEATAQWTCTPHRIDGLKVEDVPLESSVTVGEKILLRCEGQPIDLKKEGLRFALLKADKYNLHLLSTPVLTETKGEFIVTSWNAQQMKFNKPVLTDGTKSVTLGEFGWTVETVIKPETNPESKPFPPWAPAPLAWPMYLWAVAFVAILLVASLVALAVWSRIKRRRLLSLLAKNPIAMNPYNHFNKELRKLSKLHPVAGEYFIELDKSFSWYLARELTLPVFDSTPAKTVKLLKRSHPELHREFQRGLFMVLTELKKAVEEKGKTTAHDAQQLTELCRGLADQITKLRELTKKSRKRE